MRLLLIVLLFISFNLQAETMLKILSTTSTRDSGLYEYLLPFFEKKYNIKTYIIATGTGHAINNAKRCNGDILITHAKQYEIDFVKKGYGLIRSDLMYNEFIIVGPSSDPLNLNEEKYVLEAFDKIQKSGFKFISRGDKSGTHMSELQIWANLNKFNPHNQKKSWYLESGQGMGATLNIAVGLGAYAYTDRATWLKFKNKQHHRIVFAGDKMMKNQYGIIKINPEYCKNINHANSAIFYSWITSPEGQRLIGNFKMHNESLFTPNYYE